MDRRAFLKGALLTAAGTWSPTGQAIGPGQRLRVTSLRYDGRWEPPTGAALLLAQEIRYRTSIDVMEEPTAITADDPKLARLPMAVLSGDGDFSLRERERQRLKRWIEMGGFLLVDNNGQGNTGSTFRDAVSRELGRMFPRNKLERVSPEHVVFRSFYRLDYPAGRVIRRPYVEGLRIGRRFGVLVNHNDLLGAFARDGGGRFLYTPTPGGENQREMAIRFGVNIAMYALCLHYKDDQVHLDYLLHRRKWRIEKPQ